MRGHGLWQWVISLGSHSETSFQQKSLKNSTCFWRKSALVCACGVFLAAGLCRAQASPPVQPLLEPSFYPRLDSAYRDPKLNLDLGTHYFGLQGSAYARNADTESIQMQPLTAGEEMGVSSIPVFDVGLDLRLGRRNHVVAGYLWGQAMGEGEVTHDTAFNDSYYSQGAGTDSFIILEALKLGWYYRALGQNYYPRRLTLDLGGGVMQMRSEIAFATEEFEHQPGTEVIYAPLVPYFSAASSWRLSRQWRFGMNTQLSPFAIPLDLGNSADLPLLTDMPAAARFYQAELYGEYFLTRSLSVQAGAEYWDWELHFQGLEDDGNQADNLLRLSLVGGYLGFSVRNPQKVATLALRRLLQ